MIKFRKSTDGVELKFNLVRRISRVSFNYISLHKTFFNVVMVKWAVFWKKEKNAKWERKRKRREGWEGEEKKRERERVWVCKKRDELKGNGRTNGINGTGRDRETVGKRMPLNTPRRIARFCSVENTLGPLALLYISKQIGWSDLSRGIADSDKKDETTNQLFLDPLSVQAVRHDATPANVEPSELKIPRHHVHRRRRRRRL